MAVRIKEWEKPLIAWDGIDISENNVISVLLREANNLIHVNGDRELYVDLQLDDGITPSDEFPVGVTTGRILQEDWWQASWTILNIKTTSWDYFRLILANDGTLYLDPGTGIWQEIGSGGWGTECNTKTFYMPNDLTNLTVVNQAYNWYKSWKNAILWYDGLMFVFAENRHVGSSHRLNYLSTDLIAVSYESTGDAYIGTNKLKLYVDDNTDTISRVELTREYTRGEGQVGHRYIPTDTTLRDPFIPTQPSHPTSKKYVDDNDTYVGGSAPTDPYQGQLWYDTTNDLLKSYDGTQWHVLWWWGGGGDVFWPNGATQWHIAIFDDTTGKVIADGGAVPQGIINSPTQPQNPSEGDVWYDSTNDLLKYYNGTNWITLWSGGGSWDVTWPNGATAGHVAIFDDATWKVIADWWVLPDGIIKSATAPQNPNAGDVWYDTTSDLLKYYDGTQWITLGSASWIAWWQITGTLANQTDLQSALDWKQDKLVAWDYITITTEDANDMQWPCSNGYHIPTNAEWSAVESAMLGAGWNTLSDYKDKLKLPLAGYLAGSIYPSQQESEAMYWSCDENSSDQGYCLMINSWYQGTAVAIKKIACSIRPFLNNPVALPNAQTSRSNNGYTIDRDSTLGLITISQNGTPIVTMADKNLGAVDVAYPTDLLQESNCWYYYQRWNNSGFPWTGATTTTITQVDASNYWPGNYYNSEGTYINPSGDNWDSSNNANLRWGVTQHVGQQVVISSQDTTYSAGTGINIDSNNQIINTAPFSPTNQGQAGDVVKSDWNWGVYYSQLNWITVSASAPGNPQEGDAWYDTTNDLLKIYNGSSWQTIAWELTVLSYGHSTWSDFINAYNKNSIVYCRASSNTNPWTWVQWRMAFMAFVTLNSWWTPTSVEFQYYRSRSDHNSDANQQDEIYVYKLSNSWTWTVEVRNAGAKIIAWFWLESSYLNGEMTVKSKANVKAWNIDTTYDDQTQTYPNIPASLLEEIVVWLVQAGTTRLESDAILKDSNTGDIFNLVKYVQASGVDPARLEFLGTKRITYPGTSQGVTGDYTHGYMRLFTIYISVVGGQLSYSCSLDKSTDTETITNYLSVEGSGYTQAFIPTLDHQPTTKKYVDDLVSVRSGNAGTNYTIKTTNATPSSATSSEIIFVF